MRLELVVLVVAVSALAWSPSMADDPDPVTPDEAEVYIEVHGATVAVDEDEGIVDIHAGDTRIYAEEAGIVDIKAPGFTLRAERK
jgi:lipopolysaccharide export system protein LptC